MEHDSAESTRCESCSMLLCHFLAYSSKLYIEEDKLTPLFQMEPPTSRLAFLSGLFTNFWSVIHRYVGLETTNLGCRCFQITLFLVFLLFYFKKNHKFSLFLALLRSVSVWKIKCISGNWVATKRTASGETRTQCPRNLLQSWSKSQDEEIFL